MNAQAILPRVACDSAPCAYLLRFMSLYDRGRGVSVPCDKAGLVDMNTLTERLRNTYLGARAMVGREYSCPTVQTDPCSLDYREPILAPCAA
jgi:hypothetical protein